MKGDLICWDSCVLIDWIKGDDPDRIPDITSIVQNITNKQYRLVVSALVYVEVLESTMPVEAIDKFERFIQNREEVEIIAVDIRVAKKAQTIRDFSRKNDKKISTPDAVHLATAIASGAKYLHTFDQHLLSLDGTKETEGVAITPCHIPGTNHPLFNN